MCSWDFMPSFKIFQRFYKQEDWTQPLSVNDFLIKVSCEQWTKGHTSPSRKTKRSEPVPVRHTKNSPAPRNTGSGSTVIGEQMQPSPSLRLSVCHEKWCCLRWSSKLDDHVKHSSVASEQHLVTFWRQCLENKSFSVGKTWWTLSSSYSTFGWVCVLISEVMSNFKWKAVGGHMFQGTALLHLPSHYYPALSLSIRHIIYTQNLFMKIKNCKVIWKTQTILSTYSFNLLLFWSLF